MVLIKWLVNEDTSHIDMRVQSVFISYGSPSLGPNVKLVIVIPGLKIQAGSNDCSDEHVSRRPL